MVRFCQGVYALQAHGATQGPKDCRAGQREKLPAHKRRLPDGETMAPVKWEHMRRSPAPSAEELCAAMYEVLGDVWTLLEGEAMGYALARSSRRYDARLLGEQAREVLQRCEYLCKRVYGDGWLEAFGETWKPGQRKPLDSPWKWARGRRRERSLVSAERRGIGKRRR